MTRTGRHWQLEDIDFARLDRDAVANDTFAFKIVAVASFIESGSDLYTRNLREFFAGDDDIGTWLARAWEPEELRHGAALRAYIEHAWPDFDWERRCRAVVEEYGRLCTVPELEPTPALELAARCIVEMGTSTLYRALHGYAREPVFAQIADLIYSDEVRHYKVFYRHFRRYQRREERSRLRVGQTLMRRLLATKSEDGRCAYRHIWDFALNPHGESFETSFRLLSRSLADVLRRHAPHDMMTRMTLKPLALPSPVLDAATRLSGAFCGLWLGAAR
jgi:hypothetical protein